MKNKLIQTWLAVRYSLWFVPGLLSAGACIMALGAVQIDQILARNEILNFWWLYNGSPAGARALLSTIAGSMITVAGVIFSLTMVVLSLTSSQFGPRLVRNFMDDTGNQLVLGTFVATFSYCLIVLHTIEGASKNVHAPHLSVTVGVGLALTSSAVLIFFIHHIAASILANNLLARVGRELEETIKRLYPQEQDGKDRQDHSPAAPTLPQGFDQRAAVIWSHQSGYITMIDHNRLLNVAIERDLLIKVLRLPGDFVVKGEALALVWPPENLTKATANILHGAYSLGVQRNESQDPAFPAQMLSETALRALSPGVNDPFTALTCIDWLVSGLAFLAGRLIPLPYFEDQLGELRVVLAPVTMNTLIHETLDPIRQAARGSDICTQRLLAAIGTLAHRAHRRDDVAALRGLAERIKEDSLSHRTLAWDRQVIVDLYQEAARLLDESERRQAGDEGV